MQNKFPNSLDAEMVILGCMLSAQSHNDLACQTLCTEDFFSPVNRAIFNALQDMYKNSISAEVNLLIVHMKNTGALSALPNIDYLHECIASSLTSFDLEDYADVIINKSICRKMIGYSIAMAKEAQLPEIDIVKSIEQFQEKIYQLIRRKGAAESLSIKDLLDGSKPKGIKSLIEIQQERVQLKKEYPDLKCTGIASGIPELDEAINGLLPEHLVILAARPGVGKTTLALYLVMDIAIKQKIPTAFFSLEMSAEQLAFKLVCAAGEIDQNRISGCDPAVLPRFRETCETMASSPLHIIDQANIGMKEIKLTLKKLIDTHQIKFVVIDYLQLLKGADKYKNSDMRVNEVSDISRNLKLLAKEFKIPVLCLAQLNRGVEHRVDKRPMLSDLRESGAIEQDADEILMLHRPEMYDANNSPGKFEICIKKNRFKPLNIIDLAFDGAQGTFKSYAQTQKEAIEKVKNKLIESREEEWT